MSSQNNRKFSMENNKINYTLQGSQPYILSGNWPTQFIPNGTKIIPDCSMNNILGYNLEEQSQYATYQSNTRN